MTIALGLANSVIPVRSWAHESNFAQVSGGEQQIDIFSPFSVVNDPSLTDSDRARLLARSALNYYHMNLYAEAEQLASLSHQYHIRAFGPDDQETLIAASTLADVYEALSRDVDAELLRRDALGKSEARHGRSSGLTIALANNLAGFYGPRRRNDEAEPLLRRMQQYAERRPATDPVRLSLMANIASIRGMQGNYAQAERLYTALLGPMQRQDPYRALSVTTSLGLIYFQRRRFAEAERSFDQAFVQLQRRLGGRDDYETLRAADHLIAARLSQPSRESLALAPARFLLDRTRFSRRILESGPVAARIQRQNEPPEVALRLALFADAAWAAASGDESQRAALRAESFAALQEALAGPADSAVAEQAARRYVASRNPQLVELSRELHELQRQSAQVSSALAQQTSEGGGRDSAASAAFRTQQSLSARIEAIRAQLRQEAPDYFALVSPAPLDIATVQELLTPDEAILLAVPSQFGTHIVAVTRDGIDWRRSDWTAERVRTAVDRLRQDIGPNAQPGSDGRFAFDRSTAHQLHQQLIAPVAPQLAGKRVYVVAGGALAALPFSVLVSAAPTGSDGDPGALRATRWLTDDYALIHIPSIQALSLLRRTPGRSGQRDGFLGIGDPVLDGRGRPRDRSAASNLPTTRQVFGRGRTRDGGMVADLATLRRLARLPGSARELEAVRTTLRAPPESLLLAERATEPNVRGADLRRVGVLLFSTHGLTAAEAAGVGEAGLVLTPPAEARDGDDGFLAASEVTTLRLDANWVVLSACNTATGEGPSSGLSGLARAFFYAGARNLLASHWAVHDDVAPILITRTLELEGGQGGRAEALRQAMREIRMDASRDTPTDSWAHPFYWSPFVLIGDGGS